MTVRQVQLARDMGALRQLPFLLNRMAQDAVWSGDFAAATSAIAEADAVCEATGSRIAPFAAMMLASFRGREADATPLIQSTIEEATAREAIGRLGRTQRRPELARAHLLYGEWLRRERRRGEAREQLRTARQMLDEMGMEGFAERARRELMATGETARKRTVQRARMLHGQVSEPLTAQEVQVARLARDGQSNPEIGARLFISARTVQYHLSKVFTKLGISSRGQLHRVLPSDPDTFSPR